MLKHVMVVCDTDDMTDTVVALLLLGLHANGFAAAEVSAIDAVRVAVAQSDAVEVCRVVIASEQKEEGRC